MCVCIQSSNMRELVHEFIHVCDRAHEVNWGSTVYIPIDEHHHWSINHPTICSCTQDYRFQGTESTSLFKATNTCTSGWYLTNT